MVRAVQKVEVKKLKVGINLKMAIYHEDPFHKGIMVNSTTSMAFEHTYKSDNASSSLVLSNIQKA